MIYAAPGTSFETTAEGAATGLVGTIGVQILDTPAGDVVVARTTSGIIEAPAGSGIYSTELTAPDDAGTYTVVWDTGDTYRADVLRVTYDLPGPSDPVAGGYCSVEQVEAMNSGREDFGEDTKPSLADVEGFILNAASIINGLLSGRSYAVPVLAEASPVTFQLLGYLNALGASAMVERAAPTSNRVEDAESMWAWAQKYLIDDQVDFGDAPTNVTHDMPRASLPREPWASRDMEF